MRPARRQLALRANPGVRSTHAEPKATQTATPSFIRVLQCLHVPQFRMASCLHSFREVMGQSERTCRSGRLHPHPTSVCTKLATTVRKQPTKKPPVCQPCPSYCQGADEGCGRGACAAARAHKLIYKRQRAQVSQCAPPIN